MKFNGIKLIIRLSRLFKYRKQKICVIIKFSKDDDTFAIELMYLRYITYRAKLLIYEIKNVGIMEIICIM